MDPALEPPGFSLPPDDEESIVSRLIAGAFRTILGEMCTPVAGGVCYNYSTKEHWYSQATVQGRLITARTSALMRGRIEFGIAVLLLLAMTVLVRRASARFGCWKKRHGSLDKEADTLKAHDARLAARIVVLEREARLQNLDARRQTDRIEELGLELQRRERNRILYEHMRSRYAQLWLGHIASQIQYYKRETARRVGAIGSRTSSATKGQKQDKLPMLRSVNSCLRCWINNRNKVAHPYLWICDDGREVEPTDEMICREIQAALQAYPRLAQTTQRLPDALNLLGQLATSHGSFDKRFHSHRTR